MQTIHEGYGGDGQAFLKTVGKVVVPKHSQKTAFSYIQKSVGVGSSCRKNVQRGIFCAVENDKFIQGEAVTF
jgi:hypothetical protein